MKLVLATLLAIFLPDIAAAADVYRYQGAPLPPDQESVITVQPKECRYMACRTVKFLKIDGMKTGLIGTAFKELHLKPGKHKFDLFVPYGTWQVDDSLWLVTQPGQTYVLHHTGSSKEPFNFWFEDASGSRVGGKSGSLDEPEI